MKFMTMLFILLFTALSVQASALHDAVSMNSTEDINKLLDSGANINELGGFFKGSPLYKASAFGKNEIVKLLIKRGANINLKSEHGETPLFVAAINKRTKTIQILMRNNADSTIPNTQGDLPISYVAANGDLNSVKLMFSRNSNRFSGIHALMSAAETDQLEIAKYALANSVDPNSSLRSFAAIHIAAMNNSVDVMKLLIQHKANLTVGTFDKRATPPIFLALQREHTEVIDLLLKAGVNPNSVSKNGMPLLHKAATNRNSSPLKILLNYDVNIEARDRLDKTALMNAVSRGHLENIKLLLNAGANTKAVTNKGKDVMFYANKAKKNKAEILALLKKHFI
jgi:ankyrin repeat protein